MADLDNDPLRAEPSRHDGVAACRMCTSTDAEAGHDWCKASGGLICDACCQRVLLGDAWRSQPAMTASDLEERAEVIISSCLGCERGQRWYGEQLRHHFSGGPDIC